MDTNFDFTGRLKNTSLDPRDEDCESDVDKRPSSDPTSPTSSRSSYSQSVDRSSCIYKFRGERALKQPVRSLMNTRGKVAQNDVQEYFGQHDRTEQSKVREFIRPCRGKREIIRKYVDLLTPQVDAHPERFTLGNTNLPLKLVLDERGRKRTASILENYRTKILSKGTEAQQVTGLGCRGEGLPCNPDIVSL